LYKHTVRLVLSVCLLIGSGNGSTLIICRRDQGRIKTKLQISACFATHSGFWYISYV